MIMRKNMSKDDYELFIMIAQSSQAKLQKMLYKVLKRHYKNIINTSDYIIAQGDIPVALVAHMDTVFKLPPEDIYFDRQKGVLWSPDGLGADDRAGVFLILKIIQAVKKDHKPTVIFTTDEETGCIGAYQLTVNMPKAPWELKYIIELDRRGVNDCVFYDDINQEFQEYVELFGFKTDWGTLSDISVICPAWEISGVNLSVGYCDEHSEIETLHIQYTYETLYKVLMMLDDIENAEFYKYEPSKFSCQWWKYGGYGYDSPGWDDEDWFVGKGDDEFCFNCGKRISKVSAIKAKDDYGRFHWFCGTCAAEHINWCDKCGQAFIMPKSNYKVNECADCIAKSWENDDYGL